jgi:hypothetical protein
MWVRCVGGGYVCGKKLMRPAPAITFPAARVQLGPEQKAQRRQYQLESPRTLRVTLLVTALRLLLFQWQDLRA